MLGIKKFFYFVLGLVQIPLAVIGIMGLTKGPNESIGECDANGLGWAAVIVFAIVALIMFAIRSTTKCPKCKKVWVGNRTDKEDMGPCSNAFRKKSGDTYHTYEKHKYLLSYRCNACGHEYQKTVTSDVQLD